MRLRRTYTLGLCLLAVLLLLSPATTYGLKDKSPEQREISLRPRAAAQRSRSVRYPWDGQLVRGMSLGESKFVRHLPENAPTGRFYGTWQLVQLLARGSRRVAARFPGARLTIGELSSKAGGDIDGHRSHESGRDADVGFYMRRSDGSLYTGNEKFVEFDANGRGLAPNGGLRFDAPRNWELISKLVSDDDARVQFIFVARGLRQLLLQTAAKRKASAEIIERAAAVMVEPGHGNPHRSHFHVRIYCPPTDRPVCRDVAPFYAWYPGTPPVVPVVAAASTAPLAPLGIVQ
jgi:penicillin-insensitive murein endopeptidase